MAFSGSILKFGHEFFRKNDFLWALKHQRLAELQN